MAKTAVSQPSKTSWEQIEEAIFRKIDGTAEPADFEILATAGVVDDRLKREVKRLQHVRQALGRLSSLEQLAETRETLRETLKALQPKCEARVAALKQELADVTRRIQGDIQAAEAELKAAERKLEIETDARDTLRENVPEFVKQQVDMVFRASRAATMPSLEQAGTDRSQYQFLLDVNLENMDSLRRIADLPPGHPGYIPWPKGYSNPEYFAHIRRTFPEKKQMAARRLPEIEAEYARQQKIVAERDAEAKAGLDYYLLKNAPQ